MPAKPKTSAKPAPRTRRMPAKRVTGDAVLADAAQITHQTVASRTFDAVSTPADMPAVEALERITAEKPADASNLSPATLVPEMSVARTGERAGGLAGASGPEPTSHGAICDRLTSTPSIGGELFLSAAHLVTALELVAKALLAYAMRAAHREGSHVR